MSTKLTEVTTFRGVPIYCCEEGSFHFVCAGERLTFKTMNAAQSGIAKRVKGEVKFKDPFLAGHYTLYDGKNGSKVVKIHAIFLRADDTRPRILMQYGDGPCMENCAHSWHVLDEALLADFNQLETDYAALKVREKELYRRRQELTVDQILAHAGLTLSGLADGGEA